MALSYKDLISHSVSQQILVRIHKHESSGYRQIFKLSKIEWCSFMAGTAKSNYMINFIVNTIKESTGEQLFHKCPYEGRIEILEFSMKNEKLFSIYPRGKYQLDIKIADENNAELMTVGFEFDLLN